MHVKILRMHCRVSFKCHLISTNVDANLTSFYNGEAGSEEIEYTKGTQPSGFVSLDYECESSVVFLTDSYSMVVSLD